MIKNKILLFICMLSKIAFVTCQEKEPANLLAKHLPFFKKWEGKIGKRSATLYLTRTSRPHLGYSYLAHFYFEDALLPQFLQGNEDESPVPPSSRVTYIPIVLGCTTLGCLSLKGLLNDERFVGTYRDETQLSQTFELVATKLDAEWSLQSFQKDTFVNHSKWNLTAEWATNKSFPKLNCKGVLTSLPSCSKNLMEHCFSELKDWQWDSIHVNVVIAPCYEDTQVISLFALNTFNIDRREGNRVKVCSYNKLDNSVLHWEDVFKISEKHLLEQLISKAISPNTLITMADVDFANFYITKNKIHFVVSNHNTSADGIIAEAQYSFRFDELKELLNPIFVTSFLNK